ncbi:MAG TPA: hypothetical protein VK671_02265 [Mucilaginibacter sp.]|nr:hypothetical protein [Mucilaginibacter sp.]
MIKSQTTKLKYVLPIILLYSIILLVGVFHHEIFLEEAQQLTISRDSNSITDVFKNMLYEGHVTLWNTILFFITHYISARPVYMQLFHALIIASAAYMFLRYAPFSLSLKILIIFGCYFLVVYSLISRNYAVGILLLFLCCILMADPAKKMISIGMVVILMCFTHLFYVFAAIGIFVYLFFYTFGKRELYWRFAVFTCLFLFGSICAFLQTRRIPGDSIVHVASGLSWFNVHDISYGIICFARGYITAPPLHQQYFWNKQYIQYLPAPFIIILSLLIFAATILLLYKSRKALLFYIPPVVLLTVFLAMSKLGGSRYFGLYVVFFIVALWLAYYDGVTIFPRENLSFIRKWAPSVFIYAILIIQFFTGIYMYYIDIKQPFSNAENTIDYLKSNHLDTLPLAFDGYNAGPPLSAYLGRKIYYLDIDQFGSFCIWKQAYLPYPRRSLTNEIASSHYIHSFKEFILITNRNNEFNDSSVYNFNKLASFEGAVIEGEDYYVYRVTKK